MTAVTTGAESPGHYADVMSTSHESTPKRGRTVIGAVLVVIQFALLGALVFIPGHELWPTPYLIVVIAGLIATVGCCLAVIAILGLGTSLTASPVPRSGGGLVTSGVYAHLRHPIYAGLILAALGITVVKSSAAALVCFAALTVLLVAKSRWEDTMLSAKYPDYAAYRKRVRGFIPR